LLVAPARAQQAPALSDLLAGAAKYVDSYARQLAGVVFEEKYVQDVRYRTALRPGVQRAPAAGPDHRELRSDLLLIRPAGADNWQQFRDVFEVDGRPVRDRSDRLQRLFLSPAATSERQASQIAAESARYNIGDIQRTINLPVLTLLVVDRGYQSHFKFKIEKPSSGTRDLPRSPAFTLPPDVLVLSYDESARPTLVRGAADRDLPIHGRLWVDADGRVRMTELAVSDRIVEARIHVAYRMDDGLGLLVLAEMHERYERISDRMEIEGTATYDNVRRFQVRTDENIAPVK
jgi:hypothetical protein